MSESNFYMPDEVIPLYGEIVPAYQAAFAGEPWYEVSKCADRLQRCVGGLSSLAIGTSCELCGDCPSRPAYEADELVERFEALAASRNTAWYTEQGNGGLTLAAIAWQATSSVITKEKYPDVPGMEDWLSGAFGSEPFVWLDEVFANKTVSSKGNLRNFKVMCNGLANRIGNQILVYRTINPAMTRAAIRDYGDEARIYARLVDVPDRRDLVVINTGGEK